VVVKIVRPDIEKIIKRDIALMYILAKFVSKYPMSKKVRPIEIVAEKIMLEYLREKNNHTFFCQSFKVNAISL
jgi:predicted unusual protein kinase regulating ubiquinone biosynthesis (AarF/ABC1/UbiB family)